MGAVGGRESEERREVGRPPLGVFGFEASGVMRTAGGLQMR